MEAWHTIIFKLDILMITIKNWQKKIYQITLILRHIWHVFNNSESECSLQSVCIFLWKTIIK